MPRSRSPIGSKVADQPLEVIDWEPALGIAENILGSCHELLVGGTPTTSTKVENRAVGDMTYSPHAIVSPASTGATARARSSEDERADWVMQGLFVTRAP